MHEGKTDKSLVSVNGESHIADCKWMQRAIEESRKAEGLTSPNPPVGAVIVKNGIELGSGYHRKAGLPHAEREAIADVIQKHGNEILKGSTIYVTLEPCSTVGKTQACTAAIKENGLTRVVYGVVDPNPNHSGAADRVLGKAGIQVRAGVLREECLKLLRPFSKRITTGLPWVIAKSAMSLDGRITRPPGEEQWLTNSKSREYVHLLRSKVDAVLVGGKTVRTDNPRLTIRSDKKKREKLQPWRVVLSNKGQKSLPKDCHLLTDEYKNRTLFYENKSIIDVLRDLSIKGCNSVLLECGGRLMRQFIESKLIDEYQLFYAPLITGGEDLGFGMGAHLCSSIQLTEIESTTIGQDVLISGIVDK